MKQGIDSIVPAEIAGRSKKLNAEWLFSFEDALITTELATKALIAVLGVEVFETEPDGIRVVTYSGYGHEDRIMDWAQFVKVNNSDAMNFMNENKFGTGYVYILTSTSKTEFEVLKANR